MRGHSIIPSGLRFEIPDSTEGTRETLKHMRQLVRQGKGNLHNRDLANRITAQVPGKDWMGEIRAIFDYVRANVRYALDPTDIETIQGAHATLKLGYGDCDDFAVLLATLCECVGHPCCLVALGFKNDGCYEHVLTMTSGAGETPWVSMDATEGHPCGWFPPGAICEMVAPISETAAEAYERLDRL